MLPSGSTNTTFYRVQGCRLRVEGLGVYEWLRGLRALGLGGLREKNLQPKALKS